MNDELSLSFLSREQARDLAVIGERAREVLSSFSGREVGFDAGSVQLLDEWIEDYLEKVSEPREEIRLLGAVYLGEMFRRRHEAWWAFRDGDLVIVCPKEGGDLRVIDLRKQVERRISVGMSESLAYFYNLMRIELKLR